MYPEYLYELTVKWHMFLTDVLGPNCDACDNSQLKDILIGLFGIGVVFYSNLITLLLYSTALQKSTTKTFSEFYLILSILLTES